MSLVHSGEYSTAEVAELFGVGRSTVYRAIERQRVEARAGLARRHLSVDTGSRRRLSRMTTGLRDTWTGTILVKSLPKRIPATPARFNAR